MKSASLSVVFCVLCESCAGWVTVGWAGGLTPLKLTGGSLSVKLSEDGRIVEAALGPKHLARAVSAETALAGCQREGEAAVRKLDGGGIECHQAFAAHGHRQPLRPGRAVPADEEQHPLGDRDSRAREALVHGDRDPFAISRHAGHPLLDDVVRLGPGRARRDVSGQWRRADRRLRSNRRHPIPRLDRPAAADAAEEHEVLLRLGLYLPAHPEICICPSRTDLFCIPLATFVEPAEDIGLSVALSPDDKLPELTMTTDEEGSLVLSRIYHRIGESKPACFALDLVAHQADWRGGMAWMVERYPEYFDPPLPRADRMAGCGAYSADEQHFDTTRLHRMAFRSNWKCSEDYPYQGMFLPRCDDHSHGGVISESRRSRQVADGTRSPA